MDAQPQNTFRLEVEDFLTADECKERITFAEEQGFEEAMIQDRNQGQVMTKDVRDNDRVIIDLPEDAAELFERMKHLVPQEMFMKGKDGKKETWKIFGLNERFRFYRYQFGQQFKLHPDGAFKRNESEMSMVTVIIYLNDDFTGGETEFSMPWLSVPPKAGKMLLFRHRQLHKGNPVPKGIKYVLRTDVMYLKDETNNKE